MVIFWFRRDLRLDDNTALSKALASGEKVLPIFIFDANILDELPKKDARVTFIHQHLEKINAELKSHSSSIATFHGKPSEIFKRLISENEISGVFANDDYEPYAVSRDTEIEKLLYKPRIDFCRFKDHVIFEKSEIVKPDGSPYAVYTPYSKKWLANLKEENYAESDVNGSFATHSYPFLKLSDIGFAASEIEIPDLDLSHQFICDYANTRNFPEKSTSKLGPHLRFGTVSVREAVRKSLKCDDKTLLNELIWREFFMQILWHYPETTSKSFKPQYDKIPWRRDETDFKKWTDGKTGYPIVDAGMRELNATGFMHNRVRMITAGFLCKHLLIDWRWGEAYFALKLNDYEMASNVGNWQWAAGSGVDAAPYFRIFNPETQAVKFDKKLEYIRKWVPELETFDYPEPMVDHKDARQRALDVYKKALNQ